MLYKTTPFMPLAKWNCAAGSRSGCKYVREGLQRHGVAECEPSSDQFQTEQAFYGYPCGGEKSANRDIMQTENSAPQLGHALSQEVFFFCTVKSVGEIPGTGCIYVETVVDRDTGFAFAKVYSAKSAMNAVDILSSRVVPFFDHQGFAIKEIHTRKTSEYCGLVPVHPFETFLATSHIQHLPIDQPGQPRNYLCEQFYRFLLKEFFKPALRKKFQLSLDGLQKDLDIFVNAYNAAQVKHANKSKCASLHQ